MVTICNRFEKLYIFGVFAIFIKLFSRNIPKYKVFAVHNHFEDILEMVEDE